VRAKGSAASKAASTPSGAPARGVPGSAAVAARRWASTTCRTKASSQVSRVRALVDVRPAAGPVDAAQGGLQPDQAVPLAHLDRQRVGAEVASRGQPHALGERQGRDLGGGRVDRHERAREVSCTTPSSSSTSWYSGFASWVRRLKTSTLPAKKAARPAAGASRGPPPG
jgi:hypothetical protein